MPPTPPHLSTWFNFTHNATPAYLVSPATWGSPPKLHHPRGSTGNPTGERAPPTSLLPHSHPVAGRQERGVAKAVSRSHQGCEQGCVRQEDEEAPCEGPRRKQHAVSPCLHQPSPLGPPPTSHIAMGGAWQDVRELYLPVVLGLGARVSVPYRNWKMCRQHSQLGILWNCRCRLVGLGQGLRVCVSAGSQVRRMTWLVHGPLPELLKQSGHRFPESPPKVPGTHLLTREWKVLKSAWRHLLGLSGCLGREVWAMGKQMPGDSGRRGTSLQKGLPACKRPEGANPCPRNHNQEFYVYLALQKWRFTTPALNMLLFFREICRNSPQINEDNSASLPQSTKCNETQNHFQQLQLKLSRASVIWKFINSEYTTPQIL